MLEIEVKPGWKTGTSIRFEGKGEAGQVRLPCPACPCSMHAVHDLHASGLQRKAACCPERPHALHTRSAAVHGSLGVHTSCCQASVARHLLRLTWLCMQDLVFVVQQEEHPTLRRDGDDLVLHVRIGLADALTDSKIDIPVLGGRTLRVPLREVCCGLRSCCEAQMQCCNASAVIQVQRALSCSPSWCLGASCATEPVVHVLLNHAPV